MNRRSFFWALAAAVGAVKTIRLQDHPANSQMAHDASDGTFRHPFKYIKARKDLVMGEFIRDPDRYIIGVSMGTISKDHYGWIRVTRPSDVLFRQ